MKNKIKKATLTTLSGAIIASNVPLNVFADVLEEVDEPQASQVKEELAPEIEENEIIVDTVYPTEEFNGDFEDDLFANADTESIEEDIKTEDVEETEPSIDTEEFLSQEELEGLSKDVIVLEADSGNMHNSQIEEGLSSDEGEVDKTQVVISIPDAGLESGIRSALNKPTGDITQADMESLTVLRVPSKNIYNLDGLRYAINLKTLEIYKNPISDISELVYLQKLDWLRMDNVRVTDYTPISSLTSLTGLNIGSNGITNIDFLAPLTNMTNLQIYINQIEDISVVENMPNLQNLWFHRNMVEDISVIENLTKLTELRMNQNQIKDISSLKNSTKLKSLYMFQNQVEDISVLSEMTNLTVLDAYSNKIKDISVLENLTKLTTLTLYNNRIEDISALSGFTNFTNVNLSGNQIEDISALSEMTKLTSLKIGSNRIKDISALEKLTELTTLELDDNQIKDISVLENLTKLTTLDLYLNEIEDISALSNFDKFKTLNLSYNKVKDLSPLSHMTDLTELYLMGNEIEDIETLSGMTGLMELSLDQNQIVDISALSGMTDLQMLSLADNKIKDVSPLEELSNLEILYLEGNTEIEADTIEKLVANNLGIYILGISVNEKIDLSASSIMALYLKNSVIENSSDILLGESVIQLTIEDSEVKDLGFLKNTPYLNGIELSSVEIDDYSTLNELESLYYVKLEDNNILNLNQFKTLQDNWVEVGFYNQHTKLDVALVDNKLDNPFIDVDGSYITDIDLPSGVKLSEDGSELIFESPVVGVPYELTATSYLTGYALYYDYPTELKATFTISDLKTSKGEVVVTENKLSDTEKEVEVEIIDAGYGVEKIILPDGKEVEGNKATFTVTESGDYIIKYVDTKGNEFTETITIKINPIIPDVPEVEDDDKPTEEDKEEVEKPTVTENNAPVITGSNISIPVGYDLDLMSLATATDKEDGDLDVKIKSSDFNNQISGTYHVTYEAIDSKGLTATKTIQITVRGNSNENSSHTKDVIIKPNEKLDIESIVDEIAKDKGLTDVEIIENNVDTTKPGDYKVVFEGTNVKKEQEIHSIKVTVSTGEPTDDSVETGIATGGMLSLGGLFTLAGIPFLKRKKK